MRMLIRILVLCLVVGNVAWAADVDATPYLQSAEAGQVGTDTGHDDGNGCDPAVCHHCGHSSFHFLGVPQSALDFPGVAVRVRSPGSFWALTERTAAPPTRPPSL